MVLSRLISKGPIGSPNPRISQQARLYWLVRLVRTGPFRLTFLFSLTLATVAVAGVQQGPPQTPPATQPPVAPAPQPAPAPPPVPAGTTVSPPEGSPTTPTSTNGAAAPAATAVLNAAFAQWLDGVREEALKR